MTKRGRIFFHAPCFDGAVSAAIAADFLTETERWTAALPSGINYGMARPWVRASNNTPFAIVDFVFSPRAELWADHHLTTFESSAARRTFKSRRSKLWIYDPSAPSCAQLLWEHFKAAFDYRNRHFREIVGWATKIDSATYRSVHEVFESSHPALSLNLALSQFTPKDCERLVTLLRKADLEEAARDPKVKAAAARARKLSERGLKRFKQAARLEDDIVVFDVDPGGTIVNRYAPYRFFPNARYSAGIIRGKDQIKITAMRNPWKEFRSAPLGEIFQTHGGGGHRRVASVVLKHGAARHADAVLADVVSTIRAQDLLVS
ncbi:MAG: hypothetical protein WD227_16555 [Vicinamibacterales bacterium]